MIGGSVPLWTTIFYVMLLQAVVKHGVVYTAHVDVTERSAEAAAAANGAKRKRRVMADVVVDEDIGAITRQ